MDALDVVSLADAKAFLRVDFPDEDDIITDCIKAAVQFAEDQTQYRLYKRIETVISGNEEVQLFQTPLNSIISITDNLSTPTDYEPLENYWQQNWGVRNVLKFLEWQYFRGGCGDYGSFRQQAIRTITLDVGYEDVTQIPQSIIAAVKQLITFYYQNRDEALVNVPDNIMVSLQRQNRAPLL